MEASAGDEELESLLRNLHRVSQVRKAAARGAPTCCPVSATVAPLRIVLELHPCPFSECV
jgi:hypothetical protein